MRWALGCALILGAAIAAAGDEGGYDPPFRRGLPADVLAEGPPPLLRRDLQGLRALMEAAFEMSVPTPRARAADTAIEVAWPELAPEERRALLALAASAEPLRREARAGNRLALESGLARFRRDLDAYLAARPDADVAATLAGHLQLRRDAAWPGSPPVNVAASESWLELVEVVVSLGRNENAAPTAGQRSVVFEDLARESAALEAPARRRLLRVHGPWLRLQGAWQEASGPRRLALRFGAAQLLARSLPADARITIGEGRDPRSYARAASLLRGVQSSYDAYSNLARRPAEVLDLVEGWLAGGDEAARARPLLR